MTASTSLFRIALHLAMLAALGGTAGAAAAACGNDGGASCDNAGVASQPPSGPSAAVGNPINVITGNKYQKEVDLPALPGVLGLEIVRHYNSVFSGAGSVPGALGRGWKLSYETELRDDGHIVELFQADGAVLRFSRDPLNPARYHQADAGRGGIVRSRSARGYAYSWTWQDGRVLNFDERGKLVQIRARTGEILSLQHDARGLLVRVTDPQGRSLRLGWLDRAMASKGDRFRGVQHIDSPVGRFGYAYGSAAPKGSTVAPIQLLANLTRVSYPLAGQGRRYHYEDPLHPTLLTGISVDDMDADGKARSTRYATYGYGADGRAVSSTHAEGADRVTLDFAATTTTVTNSMGGKTTYRFAPVAGQARLVEVRGAGCVLCGEPNVHYGYDRAGRLSEVTRLGAGGERTETIRKTLDRYGRPLEIARIAYIKGKAQPASWMMRYRYDSTAPQPSFISRPSVVPDKEVTLSLAYNEGGQLLRATESGWSPSLRAGAPAPISRTTRYSYRMVNGRSVLAQVDGPLRNGATGTPRDSDVTTFEYDRSGNFITRSVTPGGVMTEIAERDSALRPAQVRRSDGVRSVAARLEYSFSGQPVSITQSAAMSAADGADAALVRVSRFAYDSMGQLVALTGPDGVTKRTRYDAAGRPTTLVDAKGNRIDSRFDTEGKLVAVVARDAGGQVLNGLLNLWDENSVLRAQMSPFGLEAARAGGPRDDTAVQFSGAGQASAMIVQQGQAEILAADRTTRQLRVDDAGLRLVDGAGRAHVIASDDFGRVVAERSPDEGTFEFRYGERSVEKIHTSRDGSGTVTERLQFDAGGRLIKRVLAGCEESLRYEGDLLAALEGCGNAHAYRRDAFGLIVEHRQSIDRAHGSGAPLVFINRYAYDAGSGKLTQRWLPDGQRLSYRYDPVDGSAIGVARDAGWLVWIEERLWSGAAAALRKLLPSSVSADDLVGKVTWRPFGGVLAVANGNGMVSKNTFDKAGRLQAIDIGQPGQAPLEALRYQYDRAGTIVASTRNAVQTRYHYDPMRRLRVERVSTAAVAEPGGAPAALAVAGNGAFSTLQRYAYDQLGGRSDSTVGVSYDAFGRVARRGAQQFSYDGAHRLLAVTEGGKTIARYRYDALGNRVAKTVGKHTTYFLYDAARQLVAEVDDSGALVRQYFYIDQRPVAMMKAVAGSRTPAVYAIHADQRGLPLAVTDARRQLVWRGAFDAYGNTLPLQRPATREAGIELISKAHAAGAGDFPMPLRMAGQYFDAETGLHYNIHRYYDPRQGRYMTPDPTGLAGGEHMYQYVAGNPMASVDPLGLFEIQKIFISMDPLATVFGKPLWALTVGDGGHGDIVRAAFDRYNRANGVRFSQHTIEWIIRNVYHTDSADSDCLVFPVGPVTPPIPYVNGGGQCNAKAHFDNPNDGPMYSGKVDLNDPAAAAAKLNDSYKGANKNWIKDSVALMDSNRNGYNSVAGYNISKALSNFGQNAHALADFYAHSNWVDQATRGGDVKTTYTGKDKDGNTVTLTECGWIPPGLNQRRVFDQGKDSISYAHLYTGTVAGPGTANKVCGHHSMVTDYGDITCYEDETTHGYWNKDHHGTTPEEVAYTVADRAAFAQQNLFNWEVQEYNPHLHPGSPQNPLSEFGKDWHADVGITKDTLKKGDTIYIKRSIQTRHDMAMALAILDTEREIEKLFQAAQTSTIGGFMLADIFAMDKDKKDAEKIVYDTKHSKYK